MKAQTNGLTKTTSFFLEPVGPFRLDLTVWTLRRRSSNEVDRWDGTTYRRVLILDGLPVDVSVAQWAPPDSRRLHVTLAGQQISEKVKTLAKKSLERLLGLRVDLSDFYRLAAQDDRLRPLVKRFHGMKPPRLPSLFEALANAIACQQLSLSLGILLLSRLTKSFGVSANPRMPGSARAFPRPEDIANHRPSDFRKLGFSHTKGESLIRLAQACLHEIPCDALEKANNASVMECLQAWKGIGRWSAEYVLLRGLGRLDIYPGDDVGARNNLQRWLKLRKPLDYPGVRQITACWQPYAGLIYFHLLLDRLDAGGHLAAPVPENLPQKPTQATKPMIQLKRVYEPSARSDGRRILVERLWPRGLTKETAKLDDWLRDVAPSTELRKWFSHDPAKWTEFQRRYRSELDAHPEAWQPILDASANGVVTLLFSSHDAAHNNVVALKSYLESRKSRRSK